MLALIIRTGSPSLNAIELSQEILTDLKLTDLSRTTLQRLKEYDGISDVKAGQLLAVLELARRFQYDPLSVGDQIQTLDDVVRYLEGKFRARSHELLLSLFLSGNNEVLHEEILLEGSLHELPVSPRSIVERTILHRAQAVILAHNHPQGRAAPSDEDIQVTRKIAEALDVIDVELFDHVILGSGGHVSMRSLDCY